MRSEDGRDGSSQSSNVLIIYCVGALMNRDASLESVQSSDRPWDVIIIGGGATGLGAAVDSASRGYRTLVLEQCDFAKGTSGRSTKLVHGGVRYLQQGNVALVLEALRERGRLIENAPHLVHNRQFVLPAYAWWERPFYGAGLKLYDLLSGRRSLGKSRILSKAQTLEMLPGITDEGLRGGIAYYDGQFDDARLAIALARTAADLGATIVNYVRVEGLLKTERGIRGVSALDLETGEGYEIPGRAMVNATGAFVDSVRRMDDPGTKNLVNPSQGIHIVLDRSFFPSESALLIPRTADGRVLFAVPWHDRVLLGTTDTPVEKVSLEPRPLAEEIDYLLTYAARYFKRPPTRSDVLSTFAGLRPLVNPGDDSDTASISREHVVRISKSGLITVTGGKWTTYRKMAEDTIDEAIRVGKLADRRSETAGLRLHGWQLPGPRPEPFDVYGADAPLLEKIVEEENRGQRLHPRLPYVHGEVIWATRYEMARTVEDVLSRRTRALMLDADAALESAPVVAALMAHELGRNARWQDSQLREFRLLAGAYLPPAEKAERSADSHEEISI